MKYWNQLIGWMDYFSNQNLIYNINIFTYLLLIWLLKNNYVLG